MNMGEIRPPDDGITDARLARTADIVTICSCICCDSDQPGK
jgi:hypothetical protein